MPSGSSQESYWSQNRLSTKDDSEIKENLSEVAVGRPRKLRISRYIKTEEKDGTSIRRVARASARHALPLAERIKALHQPEEAAPKGKIDFRKKYLAAYSDMAKESYDSKDDGSETTQAVRKGSKRIVIRRSCRGAPSLRTRTRLLQEAQAQPDLELEKIKQQRLEEAVEAVTKKPLDLSKQSYEVVMDSTQQEEETKKEKTDYRQKYLAAYNEMAEDRDDTKDEDLETIQHVRKTSKRIVIRRSCRGAPSLRTRTRLLQEAQAQPDQELEKIKQQRLEEAVEAVTKKPLDLSKQSYEVVMDTDDGGDTHNNNQSEEKRLEMLLTFEDEKSIPEKPEGVEEIYDAENKGENVEIISKATTNHQKTTEQSISETLPSCESISTSTPQAYLVQKPVPKKRSTKLPETLSEDVKNTAFDSSQSSTSAQEMSPTSEELAQKVTETENDADTCIPEEPKAFEIEGSQVSVVANEVKIEHKENKENASDDKAPTSDVEAHLHEVTEALVRDDSSTSVEENATPRNAAHVTHLLQEDVSHLTEGKQSSCSDAQDTAKSASGIVSPHEDEQRNETDHSHPSLPSFELRANEVAKSKATDTALSNEVVVEITPEESINQKKTVVSSDIVDSSAGDQQASASFPYLNLHVSRENEESKITEGPEGIDKQVEVVDASQDASHETKETEIQKLRSTSFQDTSINDKTDHKNKQTGEISQNYKTGSDEEDQVPQKTKIHNPQAAECGKICSADALNRADRDEVNENYAALPSQNGTHEEKGYDAVLASHSQMQPPQLEKLYQLEDHHTETPPERSSKATTNDDFDKSEMTEDLSDARQKAPVGFPGEDDVVYDLTIDDNGGENVPATYSAKTNTRPGIDEQSLRRYRAKYIHQYRKLAREESEKELSHSLDRDVTEAADNFGDVQTEHDPHIKPNAEASDEDKNKQQTIISKNNGETRQDVNAVLTGKINKFSSTMFATKQKGLLFSCSPHCSFA